MTELSKKMNEIITYYDICFYLTSNKKLKKYLKKYQKIYLKNFPNRNYSILNPALNEINMHISNNIDKKIINSSIIKLKTILYLINSMEILYLKSIVENNIKDFQNKIIE